MDYMLNDLTPVYIAIGVLSLFLVGWIAVLSFRRPNNTELPLSLVVEAESSRETDLVKELEVLKKTSENIFMESNKVAESTPVKKPRKPRVKKEVKPEPVVKKAKKTSKKRTASKQV